MDTNDLGQALLVVFGTVGGAMALLFLLAAIEPKPAQDRATRRRHERRPSQSTVVTGDEHR